MIGTGASNVKITEGEIDAEARRVTFSWISLQMNCATSVNGGRAPNDRMTRRSTGRVTVRDVCRELQMFIYLIPSWRWPANELCDRIAPELARARQRRRSLPAFSQRRG
ncbi:hypothetical protein ACIBQ1_24310 [Nonomuraea sp. NPDC050153]|uniref:hypothetical protein n=1 Tax=Nonomuraea sp. NPDC050153 TaxID=3364359 RepID=UPI0037AC2A39